MADKTITVKALDGSERKFYVSALVPMQLIQLQERLGLKLEEITKENLAQVFTDSKKLITFFAIVVNEEGVSLAEKDIDELIKFFGYGIDIPTMLEAINFFTNCMKPILKDLAEQMSKMDIAREAQRLQEAAQS